ncbi:hypothetical protein DS878_01295 [Marinobacter sp. F3R11]|nr:hypothetical protein DS878_01295 [Marinobacter sp. F3R11]
MAAGDLFFEQIFLNFCRRRVWKAVQEQVLCRSPASLPFLQLGASMLCRGGELRIGLSCDSAIQ